MARPSSTSVLLALLALAISVSADAGVGSLVYDGLLHTPLGAAQLREAPGGASRSATHNHLIVSNIGSSGQDGVSIVLGETESINVEIPAPPLMPGLRMQFDALGRERRGAAPVLLSSLGCRDATQPGAAGGCRIFAYNWRVPGAATYDVTLFLRGRVVGFEPDVPMGVEAFQLDGLPQLVAHEPTFGEDVECRGRWIKPAGVVDVSMFGQAAVQCDEILLHTDVPGGSFYSMTGMEITAQAPGALQPVEFEIGTEALGMFGHGHLAIGSAQFDPRHDHLIVSNIGSSGQDGVRIRVDDPDVPEAQWEKFDILWDPLDPTNARPAGAHVRMDAFGVVGGAEGQAIGSALAHKIGTNNWHIAADFSMLGTTTYTTQILRDGAVVDQLTGQPGASGGPMPEFAETETPPTDWHWDIESPGSTARVNHPGGCTLTFDPPTHIVLFRSARASYGGTPAADALRIIPEDHTTDATAFQSFLLTTRDIDAITLRGEGHTPSVGVVGPDASVTPGPVRVGAVRPNPFRPSARVGFDLATASAVTISIHDVAGRLVRTLVDERPRAAGAHVVSWDGLRGDGAPSPAGVYFFEIRTPEGSGTVKGVKLP